MTDREIFQRALQEWGETAQTIVAFEEMSELQKELCKNMRGADNIEQIAEEIADVQIMLEQMILLHGCEQAVRLHKKQKIERLKNWLTLPE